MRHATRAAIGMIDAQWLDGDREAVMGPHTGVSSHSQFEIGVRRRVDHERRSISERLGKPAIVDSANRGNDMLIPNVPKSANVGDTPKPGEQMMSEIQDEHGNVLFRALYDLTQVPVPGGADGIGLKSTLVKEEWPDSLYKASLTAPPPEASADPETAMKAIRLGWDILKDGRAVTDLKGASTAILNARNMNPMDYYEAKPGQSPHYYWWGYNWPVKSWKAFEVWVRINGTYGAKAPDNVAPGTYMPDIHVEFPHAPWAQWGLRMDGSTQITTTSNIGKKGNAIAYCQVLATVTVSSIVDPSRPQQFKFSAIGNTGFKRG